MWVDGCECCVCVSCVCCYVVWMFYEVFMCLCLYVFVCFSFCLYVCFCVFVLYECVLVNACVRCMYFANQIITVGHRTKVRTFLRIVRPRVSLTSQNDRTKTRAGDHDSGP